MKREKLEEALDQISEKHIAEAADVKKKHKRVWLGAIAAVLTVVIVISIFPISLPLPVKAVSTADYPKYEWKYREEMKDTQALLQSFFCASISQTLSGAGKENQTRPLASLPLFPAKVRFRQTRHVGQARPGCRPESL